MNKFIKPTLFLTIFSLAGMLIGFFIQIFIANLFGATEELDAFLVAGTLPQYIIAVLAGSLGSVLIPVFVDFLNDKKNDEAWDVASSVINLTLLILTIVTFIAILFAKPLIQLTAPGLSGRSLEQTVILSRILWPSIVVSALASLLTGIYQVRESFFWPAFTNVIGLCVTLMVSWLWGARFGIFALAWATLVGLFAQVVLLLPILFSVDKYKLIFRWYLPGVRRIWSLLWPLLFSGLFIRASTVVDRYVASTLPVGSISYLNYAGKIIVLVSVLVSTGVSTVLFPKMAILASTRDFVQLKNTLSIALRMIWLVVAPIIILILVLAVPLATVLFQRGAFTVEDSRSVGLLLSWYVFALGGASLGAMTGRIFYVLKDTKTVAFMGVLEMLMYILYTPFLADKFGSIGIAVAYCIYFTASISWQAFYIWVNLKRPQSKMLVSSFLRTGISSIFCGVVALLITRVVITPWIQILLAGGAGILFYIFILKLIGSIELRALVVASGLNFRKGSR